MTFRSRSGESGPTAWLTFSWPGESGWVARIEGRRLLKPDAQLVLKLAPVARPSRLAAAGFRRRGKVWARDLVLRGDGADQAIADIVVEALSDAHRAGLLGRP